MCLKRWSLWPLAFGPIISIPCSLTHTECSLCCQRFALTVWRPFYLLLVKPRLPCASYSKCPSSTSCFHRLCVSHTFWKCCRLSALLWGWFLVCIFKIRWAVKPASFFSAVALRESVYPKALWWSVSRAEAKKHSREFVTALHCYVNAIPDSITCSSLKLLPLKLKVLPLISRTN